MTIARGLKHFFVVGLFTLAMAGPGLAAGGPQGGAPPAITEQTIYKFCSQTNCLDGAFPNSPLVIDGAGNLYGTSQYGGNQDNGLVFKLTPTGTGWSETVLYYFCLLSSCTDGRYPIAGLIIDAAGNLYGTTGSGGSHGYGTVFKLAPNGTSWTETVLYSFCPQTNCPDGAFPEAPLIMDAAGNLYGTTVDGGGHGYGTVFKLAPSGTSWTETVLYSFCPQTNCPDGQYPHTPVIIDGAGNLYGTTVGGGSQNYGVVYKLTPSGTSWTQTVLYNFCVQNSCVDGKYPQGGLVIDAAGNLYGTASGGGLYNSGAVFKLAPGSTGWTESLLYSFCLQLNCSDGIYPDSLIMDAAGNMYGTTLHDGTYGYGLVFKLAPGSTGYTETVLYTFCSQSNCPDGRNPNGALIMDGAGNLYGATETGGNSCASNRCGVAFQLTGTGSMLSVSKSGNGSGAVASSPSGINCGSTCSAAFSPGTQVTLTATPASGSKFTGWGGACSGTGACVVTMNADASVTAGFAANSYTLSVSAIGSPGGKVTSSPAGIDCGSSCSASFSAGTQVTLSATPATAWGLSGWGGACSGIAASCTVTLNTNTTVSASFTTLFSAPPVPQPDAAALPPPVMSPLPVSPTAF